jgi:trk system potassium uptake protein TrkH
VWAAGLYEREWSTILRHSSFTVVSIMTTTGFCTEDYDLWPTAVRIGLVLLMCIGGCGGSTAGGMKVSRVLLLLKYALGQLQHALYPRALLDIRLSARRVGENVMSRILGFFFIFMLLLVGVTLLICLLEPSLSVMDGTAGMSSLETAFGCAVATLGNIGPGLAAVGPTMNYAWLSDPTKILLIFAMLVGRLEIFTVAVLVLPSFWRR